jgi:hypothetical protein
VSAGKRRLKGDLPAGQGKCLRPAALGHSFYDLGGVPSITHGPRAGGQHTVNEWVVIDDMVRIAYLYALIAVLYCQA